MLSVRSQKRNSVTPHSSVRKQNGNVAVYDLFLILAEKEK